MEFIQEFEFDIMRKFTKRIKVKQEDTARKLKMYLYANGEPISLVDKTVRIYALKPDGKIVYNGCTISATTTNLIEVPLTSQLAAVPGTVKCELCIIEGESILSSTQFNILVEGKVRNDDAVISTNEFKDVFTPTAGGTITIISGLVILGTMAELLAMTNDVKKKGMLGIVQETLKVYQLQSDLTTWVEYQPANPDNIIFPIENKSLATVINEIKTTLEQIETINASITSINNTLDDLTTRVTTLETSGGSGGSGEVSSADFTELQNKVTTLEQTVSNLNTVVGGHTNQLTELEGVPQALTNLVSRMNTLEGKFPVTYENLATDVQALLDQIGTGSGSGSGSGGGSESGGSSGGGVTVESLKTPLHSFVTNSVYYTYGDAVTGTGIVIFKRIGDFIMGQFELSVPDGGLSELNKVFEMPGSVAPGDFLSVSGVLVGQNDSSETVGMCIPLVTYGFNYNELYIPVLNASTRSELTAFPTNLGYLRGEFTYCLRNPRAYLSNYSNLSSDEKSIINGNSSLY